MKKLLILLILTKIDENVSTSWKSDELVYPIYQKQPFKGPRPKKKLKPLYEA